jgi:RimJ/RimL family protein N-acetyltransferase
MVRRAVVAASGDGEQGPGPRGVHRAAELGYLFLPETWGCGYAAEACAAALGWLDDKLPGQPVVLFTQTANVRSMRLAAKLGFTEVNRYEAWGAEQWFVDRHATILPVMRSRGRR